MKKNVLIGVVVVAVGVGVVLRVGLRESEPSIAKEYEGNTTSTSSSSIKAGSLSASEHSMISDENKGGYDEEKISDPVKSLLGTTSQEQNYNSMGSAVSMLTKDLSVDDVMALREMLTWPNDRFPEGMRPIEINAIKNDVLDRLLRQNELPDDIGLQLVEMASNPDNDPVWRDYCIQFMTPYYERATGNLATRNTKGHQEESSVAVVSSSAAGGGNNIDELTAVREAMFSALDERGSTIAGTSLIGLELLSRTHDEFDREAIVNSALDIASDESASSASRMTALRMASQTSSEQNAESKTSTVDAARMLAQTGETVLLRSAAIVTLGEVGSKEDRELLESYTTADNKQIAEAANMALEQMDSRTL